ncbi:MAG: MarR family transcriptional regulator [Oscillospiraceae bacterium]|nr:MarR family transcriptional regulator [Oscillospiraceae bacterium]
MTDREIADKLLRFSVKIRKSDFTRPSSGMLLEQGEMGTLVYLTYVDRPVYPKEISEQLEINTSRVAAILNSLEKKGYAVRKQDEEDRRKVQVTPTAQGIEIVEKGRKEVFQKAETFASKLTCVEQEQLVNLLDRFSEVIDELSEE